MLWRMASRAQTIKLRPAARNSRARSSQRPCAISPPGPASRAMPRCAMGNSSAVPACERPRGWRNAQRRGFDLLYTRAILVKTTQ